MGTCVLSKGIHPKTPAMKGCLAHLSRPKRSQTARSMQRVGSLMGAGQVFGYLGSGAPEQAEARADGAVDEARGQPHGREPVLGPVGRDHVAGGRRARAQCLRSHPFIFSMAVFSFQL